MIESFMKEYRWLSNFYNFDKPLNYGGDTYQTVEHFYVAMKTVDMGLRKVISNKPLKGLKAYGRTLEIREDWEDIKVDVMEYALMYKFSTNNPNLRKKLLNTAGLHIQEGNHWGDKFWGVCLKTGKGDNNLGKLLMKVRNHIQND